MQKISKELGRCIVVIGLLSSVSAQAYAPQDSSNLDQYVGLALRSNVALKRQALSYEQSLEALREAKRTFFPTLSFNTTYQTAEGQNPFGLDANEAIGPFLQNIDLINTTLEQTTPGYPAVPSYQSDESTEINQVLNQNQQTFVRLAVPVFNTAIIQNHKIKKELAQVNYLSTKDYKDELVKEVKTAYYQWLQAGEQVNVYQNALRLADENVRTNRSLFQNAKVTKDVYLSAQARQAEVSQQLTQARKDETLAQAFFNFLLNRDYDTEIVRQEPVEEVSLPEQSIQEYQALALNRRKDLQQVRQVQAVREAQVGLQRGNYLPRANIALDAGYRGTEYSFTNDDDFVALSGQLTWDIYTFGRNNAKVQQAKIDQQIAQTQEQELTQKITIDVVEAYLEAEAAYESYESARQEVAASQQELRLVRRKYELGRANRLELESVETDYQNAQLREVAAKYTILKQKAQLERATSTYVYEN